MSSASRQPLGVPAERAAAHFAASSSPPSQPAGFFARLAARLRPNAAATTKPASATPGHASSSAVAATSASSASEAAASSPQPSPTCAPCYLSLLYRDALHSMLSFLPLSDLAHILTTSHSWTRIGAALSSGHGVIHLPAAYNDAQIAQLTELMTAVSRSHLRQNIKTVLADRGMRVCHTLPLLCAALPHLTRLSIYEICIEASELDSEEAVADKLTAEAVCLPSAAMMHGADVGPSAVASATILAASNSRLSFPSGLQSLQINFGVSPALTWVRMLKLILLACARLSYLHSMTLNQLPRSFSTDLSGLLAMRSLTSLSLQLHSPSAQQLGVLRGLTRLQVLRLTGDAPAGLLSQLCCPGHALLRLESVELSMDYLRAEDIAALCSLPSLTRLPPAAFNRGALESLPQIRAPLIWLNLQSAITAPPSPPAAAVPGQPRPRRRASDDPVLVAWRQEREVDASWLMREVLLPAPFLRSLASLELHHVQQWSDDHAIKLASRLGSLQVLVLDCIPSLQSLSFLSLLPSLEQLAVILCGPVLFVYGSAELSHILALRSLRHLHVRDDPAESPSVVPLWATQLAVPSARMPALRCFHYTCNKQRVVEDGSRAHISVHSIVHGECEESLDLDRCCLPLDE